MTIIPQAIIDTLNGLLEGHVNSIFEFVLSGSPYLSAANADLRQLITEIHHACKRESKDLVELIESIGGSPRVKNRTPPEEQYLSFLSLKFLLPTLVNEKELLLRRYENARATIGDDFPLVVEKLKEIEAEQCVYIEKLKAAAVEATGGRYHPLPRSAICEHLED